jgi:hypothetical protein
MGDRHQLVPPGERSSVSSKQFAMFVATLRHEETPEPKNADCVSSSILAVRSSSMHYVTTVPTWWVYVAPAVAILSLMVSLASYRLASATYRRSGPRVSVWFNSVFVDICDSEATRLVLNISVRNSGLASVQVESFVLEKTTLLRGSTRLELAKESYASQLEGTTLPAELPGNSGLRFQYEVKRLRIFHRGKFRETSRPDELYRLTHTATVTAVLGNGHEASFESWGFISMGSPANIRELKALSSRNQHYTDNP